MQRNRRTIDIVLSLCLLILPASCAKEKPDPPHRLNPLDPATELAEPDPFHLTAELEGQTVLLRWQAPSMSELGGWVLLRDDMAAFDQPDTLALLDLSTTSFLDTTVAASMTYYYKALATDREGTICAGSRLAAVPIETSPSLRIDGGLEYAVSRRATLTIQTSSADSMWISNDSTFSAGGWEPFRSEVADWLLETGPGLKRVYLRILYADGHDSPVVADSIYPQPVSSPSVLSERGTLYVLSLTSTVVVRAAGADSLRLRNLGDPVPGQWTAFPAESDTVWLTWSFPDGEGWKTLVAEVKDDFLVEVGPDTVSLAVDLTDPVASFTLSPPDSGRSFVADASACYDPLGVTPDEELRVSWQWEEGEPWTPWSTERTAAHTYALLGSKTIRLAVRDGAARSDTLARDVWAVNRAPSVPGDPTPADGASGESLMPVLSWSRCEDTDLDPVTYDLHFGTAPDPTDALVTNWPNLSYPAPILEPAVTYFWKVIATDTLGLGSESTVWSFTTHAPSGNSYTLARFWGTQGSGEGELEVVRDVAVNSEGTIFVSDVNNSRVQIFSAPGLYLGEITEAGGSPLWGPYGLATDLEGSLYVADMNNHRVVKFDASAQFVWSLGGLGDGEGQLRFPRDVCVDGDGNVYVLDTGNHRVQKFDTNGDFLLSWGSRGDQEGQFDTPSGLAECQGWVYVADSFNRRIQRFTNAGEFVASWDSFGEGELPRAVEADSNGLVFVLDSAGGTVRRFDADGNLLSTWGSGDLGNPEGFWVDGNGNLVWVADTYNHRVGVFERQ